MNTANCVLMIERLVDDLYSISNRHSLLHSDRVLCTEFPTGVLTATREKPEQPTVHSTLVSSICEVHCLIKSMIRAGRLRVNA